MIADECAILAARVILRVVRTQSLPDEVLLQRITSIVLDAIKAAGPAPLPELYPGQDAKLQQALAVIDAARLRRQERERRAEEQERERAANDRRQGVERRGVAQAADKKA